MGGWLTLVYIVIALLTLIIAFFQIWKRPRLEITPISEKSYFYQKYQFNENTQKTGGKSGTVLEFCLTINNEGRGEAKVKHFYIEIPDRGKSYPDIKHIELIRKRGRNSEFRTIPKFRTSKGWQEISPPKKILVNDSYIIRVAADDQTPEGYLYFHIPDNIPEDSEPIECILRLKYGRRKAEARFDLNRGDC